MNTNLTTRFASFAMALMMTLAALAGVDAMANAQTDEDALAQANVQQVVVVGHRVRG